MSCDNPTDHGFPIPPPRDEDRKVESAVLGYLLDEHSDQFTIPEVSRAMNAGETDFEREDAIERAIVELVGAGLPHCQGGFVLPTRAALYFQRLVALAMADSNGVARHFGRNLARAHKAAGLSQEEAGIRASLHRTEIGLFERGERVPRIDTAIKVAGAVGASLDKLVDGIEWTPGDVPPGAFGGGRP